MKGITLSLVHNTIHFWRTLYFKEIQAVGIMKVQYCLNVNLEPDSTLRYEIKAICNVNTVNTTRLLFGDGLSRQSWPVSSGRRRVQHTAYINLGLCLVFINQTWGLFVYDYLRDGPWRQIITFVHSTDLSIRLIDVCIQ